MACVRARSADRRPARTSGRAAWAGTHPAQLGFWCTLQELRHPPSCALRRASTLPPTPGPHLRFRCSEPVANGQPAQLETWGLQQLWSAAAPQQPRRQGTGAAQGRQQPSARQQGLLLEDEVTDGGDIPAQARSASEGDQRCMLHTQGAPAGL